MAKPDDVLVMGAVAYAPKVVTIWEGFRQWFTDQGFPFDYVLYSQYERQVEALIAGEIDIAWNSPLAWVRARRLAGPAGKLVEAVVMRDTDCDLTSVVVVRAGSGIEELSDLRGCKVAVGAVDSPQATLIPLAHLIASGLHPGTDFEVRHHDIGVGKHGDHIGGEREAAEALVAGEVDAACMIDGNHLLFSREGTIPEGSTAVLTQTDPFDHCNFTAVEPPEGNGQAGLNGLVEEFTTLLLGMSYDDPDLRPLLDLEGLKAWRRGRTAGYAQLEAAVDAVGFYDGKGNVTAPDYRP